MNYIDTPTILIYLFWAFFFALIVYLRREDKREGYPLESDRSQNITVQGWPAIPEPREPRAKHPALAGAGAPTPRVTETEPTGDGGSSRAPATGSGGPSGPASRPPQPTVGPDEPDDEAPPAPPTSTEDTP